MTAYITIACDAEVPGLGQCMAEDTPPGAVQYATEARSRLHRAGWTRRAGRDLCPDHATEEPK